MRSFIKRDESMSFSENVRMELRRNISGKDRRTACLYGMLLFSRTLSAERICFQSKSKTSADTFGELFGRVFKCRTESRKTEAKNGRINYIYEITDKELIDRIFSKYRFSEGSRSIDRKIVSSENIGVFTAGAFLAGGSVNDPEKEYHLEITVPDEGLANELILLLGDIGISAGKTIRRSHYIVYIKGSESIEDMLTFIGAQQCTLDLINVKIYKDMRNKVNRIANCDNANINKVVTASMKQLEDIRLIEKVNGLNSLPDELREIAELRLESTGLSLQDIGDSLKVPISRSGVNHRFRRIAKIADEIRENGGSHEK